MSDEEQKNINEELSEEDLNVEYISEDNDSCQAKIKKLKNKLAKCRKESEEYLAGWQRAKADMINSRRLDEERNVEIRLMANEYLLRDLLPALDSLREAEKHIPESGFIRKQFLSILKNHGLEEIEALGKKFDPEFHEAVEMVESEEQEEDVIVEELQKGYKLNGKVIRPARVKVAKGK